MKVLIALLVIAVWVGLTSLAAWATPERRDSEEPPDLVNDIIWLNRLPNARGTPETDFTDFPIPTTTTTTTRYTTPPPIVRTTTTRPAIPVTAPRVTGDGCGGWRGLVDDYAWNVDTACRILLCESGGNPNATGSLTRYGRAMGLMQILPGGSYDPVVNMSQAWAKYAASGWAPWVCRG